MSYFNSVTINPDNETYDAFGRLRTSTTSNLFDNQMTYDLSPLVYEQITNGSGATITHSTTNRLALMTFSSTPTGGSAYMQSFQCFRYQPGKSQLIRATFNFIQQVANVLKFIGYSDGTNGIEFQNNGSQNQFVLYTGTGVGNQTIAQSSWNLDKLDGTGSSGYTLDITKANQLVIDFQALYVGRVRVGFDIAGQIIYAHEFLFSNTVVTPYIQSANLPVRCGMTCTGTVSTTMFFICSAVEVEATIIQNFSYNFVQETNGTAASGARTHLLSIRPKLTFNSITNRVSFNPISVSGLVTGNSPVLYELVLGQAITGTTTYTDVNTTYSAFEYNTAGTISGSPAIVVASGYVAASNSVKGNVESNLSFKTPISLNAAGAQRSLGTLSLLATGIGGSSACRFLIEWDEVR